MHYAVTLKDTGFFLPSEEVIDADVAALAERIAQMDRWTTPISVEARTGIIMDGNHRWLAAKRLGLGRVPCFLLDYADPRVSVFEWESGRPFDLASIFDIARTRQVFPYKTTRHLFAPPLPRCDVPLSQLRACAQETA